MTICITKLTNGEELISDTDIVEKDGTVIVLLKKPCSINLVPTEVGSIGVQLLPWMMYAKEHTIPMPADMIMTQVEPNNDLYNKYSSIFGSGIQVTESKIVL